MFKFEPALHMPAVVWSYNLMEYVRIDFALDGGYWVNIVLRENKMVS